MPRILLSTVASLLTAVLCGPCAAESLGEVTVSVDSAKVMRIPERTATLVIGNPLIADATWRNKVLVITGRSFGATNLIALDAEGTLLAEATIRVDASQASVVTVQRALERQSLSCTPSCQPAAQLGDGADYFKDVSSQVDQRRASATSAGTGR